MRTLKDLINICFLVVGHLFPRARKKIVFGAWTGNSYSDNPKFFFEYLFDYPEYQIVWIGNRSVRNTLPELPKHASFAVRHSLLGVWHALTAKTWVFSHSTNDIALVAIWGKALLFDTSHGIALKKVGAQCPSWKDTIPTVLGRLVQTRYYLVTPSSWQSRCTLEGFPRLFIRPSLPFGSSALDFIFSHKDDPVLCENLREKFALMFDLPKNKKWIMYAPTFRRLKSKNFSFTDIPDREYAKLETVLQALDAIIVEKLHPDIIPRKAKNRASSVIPISGPNAKMIEPHELWLAADGIISDYSGSVVPFFIQGKPVFHFAYDYDYYTKEDTGLVADLDDIRFGVVTKTFDELCNALYKLNEACNQCGRWACNLIEYEDGHSCERYLAFIRSHHAYKRKICSIEGEKGIIATTH